MFMSMSSPLHQLLYKILSVAELGASDRTGSEDSFGTDVYSWPKNVLTRRSCFLTQWQETGPLNWHFSISTTITCN